MRTNKYCAIAIVLAATAALLLPSALAQSTSLRATIPFEFWAAGKLLPAGSYTISPSAIGDVIRIHDVKGRNSAFVMLNARRDNALINNSRLTFRRYGTTTFLATVYWAGHSSGRATPITPRERELAKNSVEPEAVMVAAR